MSNERAEELIKKYLAGTATPEEEALLESWYIMVAQDQPDVVGEVDYAKIGEEILQPLRAEQGEVPSLGQSRLDQPSPDQPGPDQPGPDQPLVGQPEQPRIKSPMRLWPRVAAAAAVLLVVSVGSFYVFRKEPAPPVAQTQPPQKDLSPASTKATLTLIDGRTLLLDSTGGGISVKQGNARISSVNGRLVYTMDQGQAAAGQGARAAYNTLTTGRGEHYSLVLPDGTQVWLNAGSSITYPVAFEGNERKVKVTGEAYFEIIHNAKEPFRITVRNENVEDIGTHLNINAYDDEPAITTTLLEGSIKVSKGSVSAILKPGEQATIGQDGNSFQLQKVDAEKAIAWKNGYFYFDHAEIRSVMRQLARWYNVQVLYKGEIPKKTFKGKVYRNINATEALQILSYFGAHFQIDGKTITVTF